MMLQRRKFVPLPVVCALGAAFGEGSLHAQAVLPTGGQVAAGRVTIGPVSSNRLVVNQQSDRAVINWNNFSVSSGAELVFVQPGVSSALLNRVTGSTVSTIAGKIQANGQVFLVNPNGIQITPTGSIRAAGATLSTLDIADADFLTGRLSFVGNGASAAVSNSGFVSVTEGGFAALIGGEVSNDGRIDVPLGRIGLASGERATLNLLGSRFLDVAVPSQARDASGRALIDVAGTLSAAGGRIELSAATARGMLSQAVNVPGTLAARSVSGHDGDILLSAGEGGTAYVSGALDVSGGAAERGGNVVVTGDSLQFDHARVDASGGAGGGSVELGGGGGGTGPLQHASSLSMDTDTMVRADATANGRGGHVVLWSDGYTGFRGTVLARGAGGDDGGDVEVSSHGLLDYRGSVDVRAMGSGTTGSLLLDPYDVTISTGADTGACCTATANSTVINTTTLATALASANVTVSTGAGGAQNGDITVANSVSWNSGNTLTLSAARDITVNAAITGNGGLQLNAGRNIGINADLTASGGPLNIGLAASSSAGTLTVASATLSTGGGNLTASATQGNATALNLSNTTINVGTGTGTITANNASTTVDCVDSANALQLQAAGAGSITFNGTSTANKGIKFVTNATLSTSGSVALSGHSTSDAGLYFLGTNGVTVNSGSLTLSGTSSSSFAVWFNSGTNTLTNSGSFSLVGTSNSSWGVGLNSGVALNGSGNLSITGNSTSGQGLWLNSTNSISENNGTLSLTGNSSTVEGVFLSNGANSFTQTGSGAILVSGTGNSGVGLLFSTNVSVSSQGAVTLQGASTSNDGVRLVGNSTINASSGSFALSGTTSSGSGIQFLGTDTFSNSGASGFSISGVSSSGYGLRMPSAQLSLTGAMSLSGTTSTGVGAYMFSGAAMTTTGAVAVSATATGSGGVGFQSGVGTLTESTSGLAFSSSSTNGTAFFVQANTSVVNNSGSTLSLSATSSTGNAFLVGGGKTFSTTGDVTVSATSGAAAAVSVASGATVNNAGSGTLHLDSSSGMSLGGSETSASGSLWLSATGAVTQPAGSLNATNLLLTGAGGSYTLEAAGNQLQTVAASTGSVSAHSTTSATIGTVLSTTGVATSGAFTLHDDANLTIANGAAVSGASPVLAAVGNFVNNAGSSAVTATSGRWLVYAADPSSSTFGSLDSGNTALWNATYASTPPGSVSASGNRYLFATQPTLTFSAQDFSKTYGNDVTVALQSSFTVSGYHAAVSNAFLADTAATAYSGAPSLSSSGAAATAGAGSSPYAINIAAGTVASSAGYATSFTSSAHLTVTPRPVTVTADSQSRTYGDANPSLTYQLTNGSLVNGDTLSGALSTGASATSSVGTYGIAQGSLTAGSNYSLTYVGANLSVTPRAMTVTADGQSRQYGSSNPALTYQVTSGNLVNGDSLTGGLSTSADATSAVGNYGISQGTLSAGGNYSLTYTSANLVVTPRALTVTADSQSRVYGDSNPILTYQITSGSLANGDSFSGTLSTGANAASSVGNYAIAQNTLSAGSNYALSFTSANLAVTPRALTVTADGQSRVYGNTNPSLTYQITNGNLVNGDSLSGGLTTTASAASPVGNYGISQGSLAASGNYALTYAPASLAVTPRPLAITADAQSRNYGDANPALTYQITSGNLVNGDSFTGNLSTSASSASPVGNYGISQGTVSAGGNYTLSYTPASVSVVPRPLTVTADGQARAYGDANPSLTYQVTSGNLVNGDSFSGVLSTAADSSSPVGTYGITQNTLSAGNNYSLSYAPANLAVTPRAVSVTADGQSRVYGDANPVLTYQVTSGNLVNGDSFSGGLSTLAGTTSPVGNYGISQGTLSAGSNYAVSYTSASLAVTPRALAITADAQSRNYGDANPALTYQLTSGNLVNGDTFSGGLSTNANGTSPVGTYAIAQGSVSAGGNYTLSYTPAYLTVVPRPLAVTADGQSRVYGDANPLLTYQITGGNLVNGDSFSGSLSTTAGTTSPVGNYGIAQGTLSAGGNYALSYAPANLSVTPRALAITADGQSRSYGDVNPALTYQITGGNLVNGDTLGGGLSTSAGTASPVGSYGIAQGTLSAGGNYTLSYTPATLMVTPRALAVTADNQSRIYGDANPALTYQVTNGNLVNGDAFTGGLSTSASSASSVGSYGIVQGTLSAGSNYSLSYTSASLAVTPRALTLTADAQSRVYGDANPVLTYQVTSGNLVNGDTLSGSLSTPANATSSVGTYGISQGSLSASANYAVTYSPASFTVTPRVLSIAADAQSRVYGDTNPALTYQLTSGNLVNGDSFSGGLSTSASATSPVGSYGIALGGLSAGGNYFLDYTPANLAVTPRAIAVTADTQSRAYGDANPALTYRLASGNLVNGDAFSGSLSTRADATASVGSYAIQQGTLSAGSNYSLTFVPAAVTITPRALTVTADGQSRVYGDANPALTYRVSGAGLVNGDTMQGALATGAGAASPVGIYDITQGSLTAGSNYTLSFNAADLAVTPRPLTVTGDTLLRPYTAPNPTLTYHVTTGSLVNGDTLSGALTTAANGSSAVGSYDILQGSLSASSNYLLSYVPGHLQVYLQATAPNPDNVWKLRDDPGFQGNYIARNSGGSLDALGELSSITPTDPGRYVVIEVENAPQALLQSIGSAGLKPDHEGDLEFQAPTNKVLVSLERQYRLKRVAKWRLKLLGTLSVLYRLPDDMDVPSLMAVLAQDARVKLVEPLNEFEPFASPDAAPVTYNDPYIGLQHALTETDALQAHRISTGDNVRIAVIDTGVDADHPDLLGRVRTFRDAVSSAGKPDLRQDVHGTQIAGVIAAVADNRQGIAGMAPASTLDVYRACWYADDRDGGARCNSFTLAKALTMTSEAGTRLVNMSLGGPADPLLEALLRKMIDKGQIVVAALPPSGRVGGFPAGVPGVLVVGSSGQKDRPAGVLPAPGRDILTLLPGNHYDFATGSSLATAHVTGAAAMMLSIDPTLTSSHILSLLANSVAAGKRDSISASAALGELMRQKQASALR